MMDLQIDTVISHRSISNGRTEFIVSGSLNGQAESELVHTVPSDWPEQDQVCLEFMALHPDALTQETVGTLEREARVTRNALLAETDWWAVSDRTMTRAQIDYRQALRDIPEQAGFPEVTWPQKP